MNLDVTQTVRELAINVPSATRVFEQLGIDYCCGGNKSLERACGDANVPIQQVVDSLQSEAFFAESRQNAPRENQWADAPLADLISHINNTHHKFTRQEIARLGPLFDKVCRVHGANHSELVNIRAEFQAQETQTAPRSRWRSRRIPGTSALPGWT